MNREQRRQKFKNRSRAELLFTFGEIVQKWKQLLENLETVVNAKLKINAAHGIVSPELDILPGQAFLVERLNEAEAVDKFIKMHGGCPPRDQLANKVKVLQDVQQEFLKKIQDIQKEG